MKLVKGFDYRLGKEIEKTRREWREEIKKALDSGSRVLRVNGDTLVIPQKKPVAFEVWETIR